MTEETEEVQEVQLSEEQLHLLQNVHEDRLVIVQFIGVSEKSSIKRRPAPSPSGVLYEELGMSDYGYFGRGDVLYILAEDVMYTRFYKEAKSEIKLPPAVKKMQPKRKVVRRKKTPEPGEVAVKR